MGLIAKFLQAKKLLLLLADLHRDLKDLPTINDVDTFLSMHKQSVLKLIDSRALDIGCGGHSKNPFEAQEVFGVDIRSNDQRNIKHADLTTETIPFPDNYFDYLTALDFLEHVPRVIYYPARRFPFVELMNEVWRVLKPRGLFLSVTPVYPFSQAFQDPTHVNMITPDTFSKYFSDKQRGAVMYGFQGKFEIVNQGRYGCKLICLLRKVN